MRHLINRASKTFSLTLRSNYLRRNLATLGILVVDDSERWRQRICSILQTRPELRVIAQAADGLEAVERAQDLKPDLILLDIGLPSLNGVEVAQRIFRLVPDTKILFISQENDADVVAAALGNAAKGYLRKQNAGSELLTAVEAVLQGDRFVSEGLISAT